MNIKLANGLDCDEVIRLVNILLKELGFIQVDYNLARNVYQELAKDSDVGFVILAKEKDALHGICTVSIAHAMRTGGSYAIVQEMYVSPELRRRKLGEKLLSEALAHAKARGCSAVEVGTPPEGVLQSRFYKHLGFTRIGDRLRYKFGVPEHP